MPPVNSRVCGPLLILIPDSAIRLHFLASLSAQLIVQHLATEIVYLEDFAVHGEVDAQDGCWGASKDVSFLEMVLN